MKKSLVSIFCILALGLASFFMAQIGVDFVVQEQTQHNAQEIAIGQEATSSSCLSWTFTITNLSAPSGVPPTFNQRTNITSGFQCYCWTSFQNHHFSQSHNGPYRLDQGSNFVAFRHNNQPRYYIFDLHRIRV